MPGEPPSSIVPAIRTWWPRIRRLVTFAFFATVAVLLLMHLRTVDWHGVFSAMRSHSIATMLFACLLAVASHALYSCFDLLGRHLTGHHLKTRLVMAINFICYAFNLNLGALVGGVAFRYRLYSRFGLGVDAVTQVLATSMLTNWLGYLLLAGAAFAATPLPVPEDWPVGTAGLRAAGGFLSTLALSYLALCALSRRRVWTVRGHAIRLPSARLALLQLLMSSANWLMIAGILHFLLGAQTPFMLVLGVLLAAAFAGVVTHVPAGLGVLEAVFLALLAGRLPDTAILAALLAYRAIYYLAPLILAAIMYLAFESVSGDKMAARSAG
ncbi:UPF0104 family protein [Noviherbaspirillum sp. 17J57-3]|uniref:UPF0104 family protein n=2 Tax=Noviherbaspirillum galbum TaxID=2709383 RepID=A0A6B3SP91_9BURK|nr:UPF0104 family protein [Noviherbaspirillum galbum]